MNEYFCTEGTSFHIFFYHVRFSYLFNMFNIYYDWRAISVSVNPFNCNVLLFKEVKASRL